MTTMKSRVRNLAVQMGEGHQPGMAACTYTLAIEEVDTGGLHGLLDQ